MAPVRSARSPPKSGSESKSGVRRRDTRYRNQVDRKPRMLLLVIAAYFLLVIAVCGVSVSCRPSGRSAADSLD